MTSRIIRGTILVVIGLIFFLNNLGYDLNLDYYRLTIIDNIWPIILVGVGISFFASKGKNIGYILMVFGTLLILKNYGVIAISLGKIIRVVVAAFIVFLGLKKIK